MRLLLVRHGETDWNRSQRYQGHMPTSLNAWGRTQAGYVARRLRSKEPTRLYSSDIVRAWETAQIIGDFLNLTPQPVPEIREIDVGQWEGLTPEELYQRFPDHMHAWDNDPANTVRLGGESYAQMQQRALVGLRRMQAAHTAEETVVAVTHGGTIRTLLCHVIGLELRYHTRIALENASLTELHHTDDGWRMVRLNDAAHLEGLTRE